MTDRTRGTLFIVAASILWSTGGIGIKAVADSGLKVTFYRSLFAAIALMLFLGRKVWGRRQWKSTPAFIIAIISYAACLTAFVIATKWTTAANAIFLQYAGVVWVLLLSPIVLREPMRARDVIAIAVAMSGMALFLVGRFETRGMAGNGMALVSSVFFAALILVLRREQRAAQAAVTWGNVACALAVLPFISHDLALTPRSFAVLAFLGVFQIAIAYVLFVRGLAYVTATQASLTGMLEPVSNPIWVFLFLGEKPSAFAIAGALVVLAAIAWHTLAGEPAVGLPAPD
ncbi:MAG: DMT family transporter [Acidobacteria bacterium]|nr:DMT family transporter [Acidobacteriota bacterium]MBV9067186.1 DMT family transporter [Acidobacteriota bacterium]MBV9185604.1 DMT family transporter [Acidobacteriota bacterium]